MKRKAIICDVDNTLLDITHRFHFLDGENTDWDSFLNEEEIRKDKPISDVVELINCLGRFYPIIFITGRNEGTRAITEEQLNNVLSPWVRSELYMRTDRDWRKDTEIKKELYEKYVQPKYQIIAAFDDKPSVIDLWRSLGITAYHSGELATGDGF